MIVGPQWSCGVGVAARCPEALETMLRNRQLERSHILVHEWIRAAHFRLVVVDILTSVSSLA